MNEFRQYINELVHDCGISSVLAMEISYAVLLIAIDTLLQATNTTFLYCRS